MGYSIFFPVGGGVGRDTPELSHFLLFTKEYIVLELGPVAMSLI